MEYSDLLKDIQVPEDDGGCNHLPNLILPEISLPNQDGNYLRLNRTDTFRIILYFFPMTGRPDRSLPINWNLIPGAKGCTLQTCSFRDKYDEIISLNTVPIGVSTQSIEDLKEMTTRLSVPFDILSDADLKLKNLLNLPTFSIKEKIYIKRLTLVIEKNLIKKVFYPIFPPENHINELIEWLKTN
tara:strand:- start:111 stop:665 length:555 start_codon:yes stop_codon:yes gene_type:complete